MGILRDDRRMEEFHRVMEDCQLEDLGFEGPWFTWERGNFEHNNIKKRLDMELPIPHDKGDRHLRSNCLWFEASWMLEDSCEIEVYRLWEQSKGTIPQWLELLGQGLKSWVDRVKGLDKGGEHVTSDAGEVGFERWRPPEEPYIKINVDTAFHVHISKSCSRINVIYDRSRTIAEKVNVNESILSAFTVEALACLQALRLGVDLDFKRVVVEGDYLSVINKANLSCVDRLAIGACIQDIRTEQRRLRECEFVYVSQEANKSTYLLVQEGWSRGDGLNLEHSYLVEMVALNCRGVSEDDEASVAMASR
ncbi:hypothetical protein Goklo_001370 [Gossypium klotzschianum]|uniref:RNase H type-1 domain-containing protein n=1 Tax=Gossypium klotzschianum TaxID=34286 RepID=A0A7J8W0S7_9ROSI|nr:hypothetical protein [Gossypium klotzschianum]